MHTDTDLPQKIISIHKFIQISVGIVKIFTTDEKANNENSFKHKLPTLKDATFWSILNDTKKIFPCSFMASISNTQKASVASWIPALKLIPDTLPYSF